MGFVFGLELEASQLDWPNSKCTFRLKRKVPARSCAGTIEPSRGFRSKAPNRVTTMPVLVDVERKCRTIIVNGIYVGVAADHDRERCAQSAHPKRVRLMWKGAIVEGCNYGTRPLRHSNGCPSRPGCARPPGSYGFAGNGLGPSVCTTTILIRVHPLLVNVSCETEVLRYKYMLEWSELSSMRTILV